jgi:hypothetical protein
MARFSSAYFDAYNKQEDRIDKKRKDNRTAFMNYRKAKAELGEDVSAEELQTYRQSLAGNDAFFLRDMGPGQMLGDLAKRTNERALETRRAEQANEVTRKDKELQIFDTFVGQNLDNDPTDKKKAKATFMKNFVGQEDLGERLWTQNESRYGETIMSSRAEEADSYVDLRLKNVRTLAEAQSIMQADGLPQWKKSSIEEIMNSRQKSDLTTATASAETLVNNYKGTDMLHLKEPDLQNEATSIITQAKVNLDSTSQEYKDLHASIVARLQLRQSNAVTADTLAREQQFGKDALASGSEFVVAFDALGYDDQKVLDAYNLMRRNNGLSEATSIEDPTFKKFVSAAASREGIQYEADYQNALKTADTKGQTALVSAQSKMNSMAKTGFFEKDKLGFGVFTSLVSTHVPAFDPTQIMKRLEEEYGKDVINGAYSPAAAQEMTRFLITEGLLVSNAEYVDAIKEVNMQHMRIRPGSDIEVVVEEETLDFAAQIASAIKSSNFKLQIGASEEEISEQLQKIKDAAMEQMREDVRLMVNARGAFAEGPNGNIDAMMKKYEAEINKQLNELEISSFKPQIVPDGALKIMGNGNYQALAGSGTLKDNTGNALVPGNLYSVVDGDIIPVDSNTAVLPAPTVSRGLAGQRASQDLLDMGADIANLTIANGRTQAVAGIRPNPAYGLVPGGSFDSVREWQASIIKQMAEAYRKQGVQLRGRTMTDRGLFNLFNQNGVSLGGLNPGDFDN